MKAGLKARRLNVKKFLVTWDYNDNYFPLNI